MSYNFVGDAYDRTTPIEMTQVNPEPAKPALDTTLEVPDIDDFSHITLHQVKIYVLRNYCFETSFCNQTKQSVVSLESFPCFAAAALA